MNQPIPTDASDATDRAPGDRRLRELAFLNEIAQLATLARDWDELMRSIVDGTTAAMGVEVCSFYLADHERMRLTLAATNGLDRSQVGRVSLAWGQGITGRVAAGRSPIAVEDVTVDERFAWVRGFDVETLRGMLSVPLEWHDTVVGVLNVQTRERRIFDDTEIAFLQTIAALLAGIVEKGRLTAEVEARLAELTALDAARAELLSVVTHELRTPLSVVRVYVDLLAEAAAREGSAREATPNAPDGSVAEWREAAADQLGRLDRQVDSILASVRGEGLTGLSRAPFDAVQAVDDTVETLRLLLRAHPIRWDRPAEPMTTHQRSRGAGTGSPPHLSATLPNFRTRVRMRGPMSVQPCASNTGRRSSATLLTTPIRIPRVRSSRSTRSVSGYGSHFW